MEKALIKAIKGGFNPRYIEAVLKNKTAGCLMPSEKSRVLLDPLFWQALGKAEGWEKKTVKGQPCGIKDCTGEHLKGTDWKEQWHRFIDHLAEGKTADSFFENLLN